MVDFKINSPEEYYEIKSKAEVLDLFQHAVKIIINQIYGAFGNSYFYFRNYDIAESITLQGQDLIKFSIKICNHYLKNKWHLDYDLHKHLGIDSSKITPITNDVVCYVDTDSNYVVFDYIIESIKEQKTFNTEKEAVEFVLEIYNYRFREYLEHCFEEYGKFYNVKNRMKFKLEKISSCGIWVAKKMYAYRVLYEDFFRDPKTKASGLACTKSSFPKAARDILWKMIDVCLDKNNSIVVERDLIPLLKEEFEKFKTKPIEEICYNKNCNGITKYAVLKSEYDIVPEDTGKRDKNNEPIYVYRAVRKSDGHVHCVETKKKGLVLAEMTGEIGEYYTVKGCGADVKGCLWYNSILIQTHNVKYNKLRDGEKVKMYYAKNDSNKDVETFCYAPGLYDESVAYPVDYEAQFDYSVLRPLNALLNAMNKQSIGSNLKRKITLRGFKKPITRDTVVYALDKETLEYEVLDYEIVKYAASPDLSVPERLYDKFESVLGKYGDDLIIMPEAEMFKYISQRENALDKKENLNLIQTLGEAQQRYYSTAVSHLKTNYKFKFGFNSVSKLTEVTHKSSKKSLILDLEMLGNVKCADALVNIVLDYFDDLNGGGEDGE